MSCRSSSAGINDHDAMTHTELGPKTRPKTQKPAHQSVEAKNEGKNGRHQANQWPPRFSPLVSLLQCVSPGTFDDHGDEFFFVLGWIFFFFGPFF